MSIPDLTNLSLSSFLGLLLLVAAFDVVTAYVVSAAKGTFSLGAVAIYLQSHVLLRVFPIFATAVLGHGIPQLGIPAIPAASLAAVAFATTYILETVASIRGTFGDPVRPTDADPAS